jgi:hypothetical protein
MVNHVGRFIYLRLLVCLVRSTAKTTGTMRRTIKIVTSSAPVPLSGETWNICSMKFMWTSVSHHDAAKGLLIMQLCVAERQILHNFTYMSTHLQRGAQR